MKNLVLIVVSFLTITAFAEEVVIGLNYPETGPYDVQGLAQKRASDLAIKEINSNGGILGKQVRLVSRDTASKSDKSVENVRKLIEEDKAAMVFGGSSSSVAIAGGKIAKELDRIYFGTLTYSNTTTGKHGHTHMFRETYNAWMAAKVLSKYLNKNYAGKKYFYVTADYSWGHSTEESIRTFSNTSDVPVHRGTKTPFPGATRKDFQKALTLGPVNTHLFTPVVRLKRLV